MLQPEGREEKVHQKDKKTYDYIVFLGVPFNQGIMLALCKEK